MELNNIKYSSQASQDKFVCHVHKFKRNGFYIDVGAGDPKNISNTFALESELGWGGILIDYNNVNYAPLRPNSVGINADATSLDYAQLFKTQDVPPRVDFLSFDLEVDNNSTLVALKKFSTEIMSEYRFSCITFEHDVYRGNKYNTRSESRKIFEAHGYFRVFSDVCNSSPYEDWYVDPDFVDMNYISQLQTLNLPNQKEITRHDLKLPTSIEWSAIEYP